MNRLKLQSPQGTLDYLPDECREKKRIEGMIRTTFLKNGYQEMVTPSFEYYDVFTHDAVPYVQENMIKFFDLKGRILALRPDSTGPIARIAATKLLEEAEVLRLCYIQNAFGFLRPGLEGKTEFTQAGVELLGKSGADADAEVIALAVQALLAIGLEDFQIDIGQIGYFRGVMGECGLDEETAERIRQLVDSKNNVELEYELGRLDIADSLKKIMMQLGSLFGGPEALDRAESLAVGDACRRAVENVREVYEILEDFGYGQYLSVDLGMLNDFNYYTGTTFRGIARGMGSPVLSGGRYDRLLREFGVDAPATGFAIGIRELLLVLERQGKLHTGNEKTVVLRCGKETRRQAYARAQALRDAGRSVIVEMNGGVYDEALFEILDIAGEGL